jgi:hypothetical protein
MGWKLEVEVRGDVSGVCEIDMLYRRRRSFEGVRDVEEKKRLGQSHCMVSGFMWGAVCEMLWGVTECRGMDCRLCFFGVIRVVG